MRICGWDVERRTMMDQNGFENAMNRLRSIRRRAQHTYFGIQTKMSRYSYCGCCPLEVGAGHCRVFSASLGRCCRRCCCLALFFCRGFLVLLVVRLEGEDRVQTHTSRSFQSLQSFMILLLCGLTATVDFEMCETKVFQTCIFEQENGQTGA